LSELVLAMHRLSLLLLTWTWVSQASLIVYVGSTGCDEDDISCHDSNQPPSELFAYDVLRNGFVVPNPQLHVDVGGLPLWLTVIESDDLDQKCMFAALNTQALR